MELNSQAAPSIILKEARENIETETGATYIKEKFAPDRSAAADLDLSPLALYELMDSQVSRAIS